MEGCHHEVSAGVLRLIHHVDARSRILTAPYEDRDGWELNVMSVNGTLYLEEHLSEAKLRDKYGPSMRSCLSSFMTSLALFQE